jgi:predicted RNase H-like HicB family nuclease
MNKSAILKTVRADYSPDDECFVARSPLSDVICGHGASEEEALASFRESVAIHWEEYQAGRHGTYRRPGRPSKGKTKMTIDVDPEIREALAQYAKAMGLSQGEMVEHLCRVYQAQKGV